ncbi:MAG: hypothetical protein Q7S63_00285 [bacterium]|nr:hypothetical protein [bacterium]
MRFHILFPRQNLTTLIRRCGYSADGTDEKTGESRFFLSLSGDRYPRYHLYCASQGNERKAICNLHLDQKQPSYEGVSAHSGEYEGFLVESEVQRIQDSIAKENSVPREVYE